MHINRASLTSRNEVNLQKNVFSVLKENSWIRASFENQCAEIMGVLLFLPYKSSRTK